jgi:hypothetical protein
LVQVASPEAEPPSLQKVAVPTPLVQVPLAGALVVVLGPAQKRGIAAEAEPASAAQVINSARVRRDERERFVILV